MSPEHPREPPSGGVRFRRGHDPSGRRSGHLVAPEYDGARTDALASPQRGAQSTGHASFSFCSFEEGPSAALTTKAKHKRAATPIVRSAERTEVDLS